MKINPEIKSILVHRCDPCKLSSEMVAFESFLEANNFSIGVLQAGKEVYVITNYSTYTITQSPFIGDIDIEVNRLLWENPNAEVWVYKAYSVFFKSLLQKFINLFTRQFINLFTRQST